MDNAIITEQKKVCEKYNTTFSPGLAGWKIGISKSAFSGQMPINGLRHPSENGTTGWYVWAGDFSDDIDFFDPMHMEHLAELGDLGMLVLRYLALPPGWRFQIDNKGYEDVWEDKSLLNI